MVHPKHPTNGKMGTVALIIQNINNQPKLIDTISDDQEIVQLEVALDEGEPEPLKKVYQQREHQKLEEERFADYVEELLTQAAVRPEIREHGVQWLMSKMKIEQYQKNEAEAAKVIAQHAFELYQSNPSRTDFILAGHKAKVRVKVINLPDSATQTDSGSSRAA